MNDIKSDGPCNTSPPWSPMHVSDVEQVWYHLQAHGHHTYDDGEHAMNEVTTASALSHDELVERIARQAINSTLFDIYTNTKRAQTRPVKGQYPHIVGVGKTSKRVELVGMVETAESLHNLDAAARRWRTLALLQAAIYLYIPRGYGPDARALCLRQTIRISDFRHYWFDDDSLHIEKYFA